MIELPQLLLDGLQAIAKVLLWWSPSIVGVCVGGFIVQRYWVRKANESALIEYLSKELNTLVDITLEYWSLDCSGKSQDAAARLVQSRKLEQKIKGSLKGLTSSLNHYSQRYCKHLKFDALMEDLHHACMCGEFEQADRKSDGQRYLPVINCAHRVRSALFERRV